MKKSLGVFIKYNGLDYNVLDMIKDYEGNVLYYIINYGNTGHIAVDPCEGIYLPHQIGISTHNRANKVLALLDNIQHTFSKIQLEKVYCKEGEDELLTVDILVMQNNVESMSPKELTRLTLNN